MLRAEAHLGLAHAHLGWGEYDECAMLYERAMLMFGELGDSKMQAIAHHGLQEAYSRLHNEKFRDRHQERAQKIERAVHARLDEGGERLTKLKSRLIASTAEQSKQIKLERVSGGCIRMRKDQKKMRQAIVDAGEDRKAQEKETAKIGDLLERIKTQLEDAKTTDKDEMASALVHGKEQIFEIEELKVRLAERQVQVQEEFDKSKGIENGFDAKIRNWHDDIAILQEERDVEEGGLMRHVMENRTLRCIALNPANAAGNEVTGTATGGVELVVGSEGTNINVFNIHDGELKTVFTGDEPGRHVGAPEGHISIITCLYFYSTRVYSGSMDTTIMVWDVEAQQRVLTLEGHEATVCCIAVASYQIVSGAADNKIHIWDLSSGALLRLLHGHAKSVNCLHIGPTWMVSGGADAEVRVWDLEDGTESKSKFRKVRCRKRLRDLEREIAITVCKYGKLEVLTGSADGVITVWWLKSGAVLQRCKAHEGMVHDLQFDATRVVSAGTDGNIVVTDITTGEPVQSLRGHTKTTLAVAFDPAKIISTSADNTLRHWDWGSMGTGAKNEDKFHTYDQGDNLAKIAQKYHTTVPNLVQWNAIVDVRKLYLGQKLIVQKGNPDEPTEAEKAAEERAAKAKAKAAKIEGNTGSRGPSDDKAEAALKAAAGGEDDGPGSLKIQMGKKRASSATARRATPSYVARVDAAMDKTLLDADRHDEVEGLDKNWYNKKSLTARLKVAVLGMVDPFAEDAEQQMKALEEVKPKKKKANDDDDSDEEVDENITSEEEQAAMAAASLQERLVMMVEDFIVRAVVAARCATSRGVQPQAGVARPARGPADGLHHRGAVRRRARPARAGRRRARPLRRRRERGRRRAGRGVREPRRGVAPAGRLGRRLAPGRRQTARRSSASRPRARPPPRPTATRPTRRCSRRSRTTGRRSSRTRTSRRPPSTTYAEAQESARDALSAEMRRQKIEAAQRGEQRYSLLGSPPLKDKIKALAIERKRIAAPPVRSAGQELPPELQPVKRVSNIQPSPSKRPSRDSPTKR